MEKQRLAVRIAFRMLQIVFVLLLLGAAEVAARIWFDPSPKGRYLEAFVHEKACRVPSRLLGSEHAPNCRSEKGVFAQTLFSTNELGLRDAPIFDDGVPRILCIGDSTTFGWRVADDETYPAVLQRLLDARYGSRRYRVINAGVPGYTSYQGVRYLRERGLALRPAIVLFGYGFNDSAPRGDVEKAIAWNDRLFHAVRFKNWALQRSSVLRWAKSVGGGRSRVRPGLFARPRASEEKYRRNLGQIVALSREGGARPFMLAFGGTPYEQGEDLARALGVPLVVYTGPKMPGDVVHPTREGYAALARVIADRLEALGYVEGT